MSSQKIVKKNAPVREHATHSRKRPKIMKICAPARERATRSRKRQKNNKMCAPARRHRPKTCSEINLQRSSLHETLHALSYGL